MFFLSLGLFFASGVWASDNLSGADLKPAFHSVSEIEIPQSSIPVVVEVPIKFENNMFDNVMVIEKESQKTQPVVILNKNVDRKSFLSARDSFNSKNIHFLTDGKINNFQEYSINNSGEKQYVEIILNSDASVTSSSVTFYLDEFVSLPETIEIKAIVNGEDKIILGKKDVTNTTINFPKVTALEFRINLEYVQPLRIRELTLSQENLSVSEQNSIRFLAQPDKKYEVYFNADRYANSYGGEMPDLNSNKDIVLIKEVSAKENYFYKKSDVDKDGVADEIDNCVQIANTDQADINKNSQGDACDDFDRDGVINQKDNCRDLINRDQKDKDFDGIGDVCDKKENRILQNQKWLPLALIILVAGIVGLLLVKTMKAKE